MIFTYFLPHAGLPFCSVLSFDVQIFKIFIKSNLPIFSFVSCTISLIFKKLLPNQILYSFFPMFLKNSIVLSLTFRSSMYFSFLYVLLGKSQHDSYPVFSARFMAKTALSPLKSLDIFVKNCLTMSLSVYF